MTLFLLPSLSDHAFQIVIYDASSLQTLKEIMDKSEDTPLHFFSTLFEQGEMSTSDACINPIVSVNHHRSII
jgi:hypothetical protein